MSEITTATWNAQNAFSDKSRYTRAFDEVLATEADIVGVLEYSKGLEEDEVAEQIELYEREGYHVLIEPYFDKNIPTPYGHHRQEMMAMIRGEGAVKSFEAGNRIAMHASKEGIEAILVHHEDVSETERLIGATAVLDYLERLEADESDEESIEFVGGDFNSIDPDDKSLFAQSLRLVRPGTELTRRLLGDKVEYYGRPGMMRLASLAIRLASMSEGATVKAYKESGFKQSDPDFIPTIGFSRDGRKVAKLDHSLYRDPSGLAEVDYRVAPTHLSDHDIAVTTIRR